MNLNSFFNFVHFPEYFWRFAVYLNGILYLDICGVFIYASHLALFDFGVDGSGSIGDLSAKYCSLEFCKDEKYVNYMWKSLRNIKQVARF